MPNKRSLSSRSATGSWPPGPGTHSVAVRLRSQGQERLLFGNGTVDYDPELGEVFEITLSSSGDTVLIATSTFIDTFLSGSHLGCDYLICLN